MQFSIDTDSTFNCIQCPDKVMVYDISDYSVDRVTKLIIDEADMVIIKAKKLAKLIVNTPVKLINIENEFVIDELLSSHPVQILGSVRIKYAELSDTALESLFLNSGSHIIIDELDITENNLHQFYSYAEMYESTLKANVTIKKCVVYPSEEEFERHNDSPKYFEYIDTSLIN